MKEDAVKRFLKLLSSVKGTVSSRFSSSQNLIAEESVFDATRQVLPFLLFLVSATDITGTEWAFTYFSVLFCT